MSTVPTKYWKSTENDKVQCTLCPRLCTLSEGQRGFCYVRGRENNKIVLHTYGRSSGFCVDPIEKKPLNHFFPGTPVLSFGTAGCNLACKFCQNWDISKSREMDILQAEAGPSAIVQAAKSSGSRSIAFTYNDPIIFLEYARDIALEAKREDIKTVAVTAGYITDMARPDFFEFIDATNVDLKSFNNDFYRTLTGGELKPVLDTLVFLKHHTNVWFEITTLLIPGENDSDKEISDMVNWIVKELGPDVPLHFSAFHPDWKMRDIPATPGETLTRARQIASDAGLHYVYTGNVHDPVGSSTYCNECGNILIERDWYQLGAWNLSSEGKCNHCGSKCAGLFEERPGSWGARRLPIAL